MRAFVDTSALYALFDEDDDRHGQARETLALCHQRGIRLVTHAYVVVESLALVHARLGRAAVRRLVQGLLPIVDWHAVPRDLHERALAAYVADRGRASFVDWTSFTFARDEQLEAVFGYGRDFERQGFRVLA
jgi:predicted nucleic acid-binding protein